MIAGISIKNIKGLTLDAKLTPLTLITGANMSGKSGILSALRLAVKGFLPELGKRSTDIQAIAGDQSAAFGVSLLFDNGRQLARHWTPKKKGGYKEEDCPCTIDHEIFKDLSRAVDWEEFLTAKPKDRINQLAALTGSEMPELSALLSKAAPGTSGGEILLLANEELDRIAAATTEQNAVKKRAGETVKQMMATVDLPARPAVDVNALRVRLGQVQQEVRELYTLATTIRPVNAPDVAEAAAEHSRLTSEYNALKAAADSHRRVPRPRNSAATIKEEMKRITEIHGDTAPHPNAEDDHLLAKREVTLAEQEAQTAKNELNKLPDGHTIACPCCGQDWDVESARAAMQGRLLNAITALDTARRAAEEIRQKVLLNDAWRNDMDKLKGLVESLPSAEKYEEAAADMEEISSNMSNLSQEVDEAKERLQEAQRCASLPTQSRIDAAVLTLPDKNEEQTKLEQAIADGTAANQEWEAHRQREDILKQAEKTGEDAAKELEDLAASKTALTNAMQSEVQRICRPIIAAAATVLEPVIGKRLEMEGDDFGIYSEKAGRVITWELLSGTEQKLVTAALQIALGRGGLVFLDELSELDNKYRRALIIELEHAVARKMIEQVIVVDHSEKDFEVIWNTIRLS